MQPDQETVQRPVVTMCQELCHILGKYPMFLSGRKEGREGGREEGREGGRKEGREGGNNRPTQEQSAATLGPEGEVIPENGTNIQGEKLGLGHVTGALDSHT